MRETGTTLIYVSHRLPEVFTIADQIHVLRDGRLVASYARGEIGPQGLVRAMVGRELAERPGDDGRQARRRGAGDSAPDRTRLPRHRVRGRGRRDRRRRRTARFGPRRPRSGALRRDPLRPAPSRSRARRSSCARRATLSALGIGYVPAERRSQGIFPDMSIASNLAVLEIDGASRFGLIRRGRTRRLAERAHRRLRHPRWRRRPRHAASPEATSRKSS